MATIKISELSTLTDPAADDQLVINDDSEPSDADKTKRIAFSDLVNLDNMIGAATVEERSEAGDLDVIVRGGVVYTRSSNLVYRGTSRYGSTVQSIPNATLTAITLSAIVFGDDPYGFWNAGQPTRLTAPITSTYLIVANYTFVASNAGYRYLLFGKNGTPFAGGSRVPAVQVAPTLLSVSMVLTFTAGSYLETFVEQTSGGALVTSNCSVSMTDLGFG